MSNREDISKKEIKEEIPFQSSNIETIDYAIYDWLNNDMSLFVTTNKGWEKVDIIWVSAERAYQSKKKRERRDLSGTINYPLIMIGRKSVVKDPAIKGTAYGNVPHEKDAKGGAAAITIAKRINQIKTSEFANAETKKRKKQINFPRRNEKIVYETISIPMPVYVNVVYEILLRTQYQQQMNELVQPFVTRPGGINYQIIKRDGHRYEAFIEQDFVQDDNASNLAEEERKYETRISVRVLAYLIGEGENQKQPIIVKRENAVEFNFPRERIIIGDSPEHTEKQNYVGSMNIKGIK